MLYIGPARCCKPATGKSLGDTLLPVALLHLTLKMTNRQLWHMLDMLSKCKLSGFMYMQGICIVASQMLDDSVQCLNQHQAGAMSDCKLEASRSVITHMCA